MYSDYMEKEDECKYKAVCILLAIIFFINNGVSMWERCQKCGSTSDPINNSKGCGGVMRVAPVGLYLPKHCRNIEEVDQTGAEIAAITHGHPLGYIPAAALVHIISRCTYSCMDLERIVTEATDTVAAIYKSSPYINEFVSIMNKAIYLAHQNLNDLDAIQEIGQGWVAEETLAIAVYCSLKYSNDFVKAVTASVNHSGDSDSTGAVTGNVMGAYLGQQSIPDKFIRPLELREVISEIAVDLFEDCKMEEYGDYYDDKWFSKYCTGEYKI